MKVNFPNTISILWALMCMRISFGSNYATTMWFEKVIWGAVVLLLLPKIFGNFKLSDERKHLFYAFFALVVLMILGLFLNATSVSFTAILGAICVFAFILDVAYSKCEIQMLYIRLFYYYALIALLLATIRAEDLGNSIPGCIIFLTCAYFVAEFYDVTKFNKGFSKILFGNKKRVIMLACFAISFWLSWNAASRAASLAFAVIMLAYVMLTCIKKERSMTVFFWIIAIGALVATMAYARISTFSWYEELNEWSLENFDKQADSRRPKIWLESLNGLTWWQWVVGKGTGTLPPVSGYETASFHNSYVQLLMQNGLLGLSCLIAIFRILWVRLAKHQNDPIIRFVLAAFVGIMIYNCFECTLIQNKAFLGIVQWGVLSFGIIRCRYLESINKEKDDG